jgi:hypothetical protein
MTKQDFILIAEKTKEYVTQLGLICEYTINPNYDYSKFSGFITVKNEDGLYFQDAISLQEMINNDLSIEYSLKQWNGFYILYKRAISLEK